MPVTTNPSKTGISDGLVLDVRVNGALGDGVADDTSAIQRAVNEAKATGRAVHAVAGNYKITQQRKNRHPA